jgi:vacuolar-type H+-ATPase catalytic subunit A/Vma1
MFPATVRPTAAGKVTLIAITAALYAVAKGLTAFIPTPFGVGQFLLFIFVPAFFAITGDTLSAATGAAIGTFLGDTIFLTPLGQTNPALSLVSGVPANFVAFLLYGYLVKRYRSWPAFISSTVLCLTLGNLIAATLVVAFAAQVFLPAFSSIVAKYGVASLVLGYTLFWTGTMVPAVVIAIPLLLRALRPLVGRSSILSYYPEWSDYEVKRLLPAAIGYAIAFIVIGVGFFVLQFNVLQGWSVIGSWILVAGVVLAIVGPVAGLLAGTKRPGY